MGGWGSKALSREAGKGRGTHRAIYTGQFLVIFELYRGGRGRGRCIWDVKIKKKLKKIIGGRVDSTEPQVRYLYTHITKWQLNWK
jgi:hypothetical protein